MAETSLSGRSTLQRRTYAIQSLFIPYIQRCRVTWLLTSANGDAAESEPRANTSGAAPPRSPEQHEPLQRAQAGAPGRGGRHGQGVRRIKHRLRVNASECCY